MFSSSVFVKKILEKSIYDYEDSGDELPAIREEIADRIDKTEIEEVNKKEKNALVTLIEKSNIKTYVANLENLAFNLRVNISIVRSNMKMCKDAFQLFHKQKPAQDGTNKGPR